jgi:hypothetical protein
MAQRETDRGQMRKGREGSGDGKGDIEGERGGWGDREKT